MKNISTYIKPILALSVILLTFGYFYMVTIGGVNPNDQILIAIVGFAGSALGYYFGASTGGAKKDETIQELLKPKTMKYDVILLTDEAAANDLAKNDNPAFKCTSNGNFYTYTDVTTGTTSTIDDAENAVTFKIVYEGSGPVLKNTRMFPR